MTAVLQAHARKHHVAIDTVWLSFEVTSFSSGDSIYKAPADGVYVDGLTIDAGRWDPDSRCLSEPLPGVMTSPLPILHIIPRHIPAHTPLSEAPASYFCPLYKTAGRAGSLSTTGQSSNFVISVNLPVRPGTHADYWVLQGVALILCRDGG